MPRRTAEPGARVARLERLDHPPCRMVFLRELDGGIRQCAATLVAASHVGGHVLKPGTKLCGRLSRIVRLEPVQDALAFSARRRRYSATARPWKKSAGRGSFCSFRQLGRPRRPQRLGCHGDKKARTPPTRSARVEKFSRFYQHLFVFLLCSSFPPLTRVLPVST